MHGPYADHILDAADTCSNCHRLIRVERLDPVRGGLNQRMDSHLSRRKETTTAAYGPADVPAESKGVFCDCGTEDAHHRLWDPTDVTRERFKTLLANALETLEHKDVTLERKETVMYGLSHFDEHNDVDRALATALDAGIVAAVASSGDEDRDEVRA
jgi:hypothetical protein